MSDKHNGYGLDKCSYNDVDHIVCMTNIAMVTIIRNKFDFENVLPLSTRFEQRSTRYCVFFQRWVLDSIRLHGELLSRPKCFCCLKSRGPLNFFFKLAKMESFSRPIDWHHAHPPLSGHFKVPLTVTNSFLTVREFQVDFQCSMFAPTTRRLGLCYTNCLTTTTTLWRR